MELSALQKVMAHFLAYCAFTEVLRQEWNVSCFDVFVTVFNLCVVFLCAVYFSVCCERIAIKQFPSTKQQEAKLTENDKN